MTTHHDRASRVIPQWADFNPLADTYAARRLRAILADAYAVAGRDGLEVALREEIAAAARGRAMSAEERAVLRAWLQHTFEEALPAWLVAAAAERWPRDDAS